MILKKINLVNYRGFEQIEFDFHERVTVIAGVNGVGKSGILLALTAMLSRALRDFTPSSKEVIYFKDEDIFGDKKSLQVSSVLQVAEHTCHITIQRVAESDEGNIVSLMFENLVAGEDKTGLDSAQAETSKVLRKLKERRSQPLAIYFSPQRQLPGKPRVLPPTEPFSVERAYQTALENRPVELRDFMHWFRVQEELADEHQPQRLKVLETLKGVVTTFLSDFSNLRLEMEPLRLMINKLGVPLAINQLSDGERGILAILFDITRRLSIANPDLKDPIKDGKAIILIDEIDLHLHPTIQRKVLRQFTNTFQNCQFIVTTHSPQVIGQSHASSIRALERDEEDNKVKWVPVTQSFGMDSNWVLQRIMGALPRDFEIEQNLRKIADAIDDGNWDSARAMVMEIEEDIGIFPELQEWKSMLDRIELLENEANNENEPS
ncbi:recombination protein F [Gimesia panareensis]|uniref:Recombination protein F n=1 Tax=Gimesia panareensis TaxID=2527978 RepID=A0A517PZK7_9PLAN|nr:AAA family ATPase [Gimesia panareensis]QDT24813.1 recombination protein F [Gimesia panareensis]